MPMATTATTSYGPRLIVARMKSKYGHCGVATFRATVFLLFHSSHHSNSIVCFTASYTCLSSDHPLTFVHILPFILAPCFPLRYYYIFIYIIVVCVLIVFGAWIIFLCLVCLVFFVLSSLPWLLWLCSSSSCSSSSSSVYRCRLLLLLLLFLLLVLFCPFLVFPLLHLLIGFIICFVVVIMSLFVACYDYLYHDRRIAPELATVHNYSSS